MFAWSQKIENVQIPLIGDQAIKFTGESTNGPITFPDDYGNKWKILFSHPKDFTPVCSSELLELASMQSDFKNLNTAIVVVSTDNLSQHKTWKESLETVNYDGKGLQKIDFPLVADENKVISSEYGMIHANSSTTKDVRGVFIVNPDNKIAAIFFYPTSVGRNMDEIKRTLIALQTAKDNVVLPANWQPGKDVILSYMTPEQEQQVGKPNSDIYQVAWYMTFMKIH
jgi:peroxiredoxin (alkyl hydroperoxide reductase subunit C)